MTPTRGIEFLLLTPEDVPRMVPLAQEFYGEGHLMGEIVPEVFTANWKHWIETNFGLVLGAEKDGELVGVIGGLMVPDANDAKPVMNELFWFVTDEHRKGRLALQLLKGFEHAAAVHGASRVTMAHLANDTGERLGRLFQRRGYRPMETHYMKDLEA